MSAGRVRAPMRASIGAAPLYARKPALEPSAGLPSFQGDPAALAGAGASAQWPR
ncbi:hypothetical protein BUUB107078_30905 [Burkholderia ubonensis]|nr:hypothetical protein BUB20358_01123 [Burkholderia ubonensis]